MNRLLALTLSAAFMMTAAPVFAEHHDKKEDHTPRHERFYKETDKNNDGFITKDEMRAAQETRMNKMFEKMDKDKDGKLSKDELKQGREQMHKKMRKRFRLQG